MVTQLPPVYFAIVCLVSLAWLLCFIVARVYAFLGRRFILIYALTASYSFLSFVRLISLVALGIPSVREGETYSWPLGIPIILAILMNAVYNSLLLFLAAHLWATVTFSTYAAAYGSLAVNGYLILSVLVSLINVFTTFGHVWFTATDDVWYHVPTQWVNILVLCLIFLLGSVFVGGTLKSFWRQREHSFEVLRKSSISRSLVYRLLFALVALVLITGINVGRLIWQVAQYTSVHGEAPVTIYTPEQDCRDMVGRQLTNAFTGICLFLVFGTSEEARRTLREWWRSMFVREVTSPVVKGDRMQLQSLSREV